MKINEDVTEKDRKIPPVFQLVTEKDRNIWPVSQLVTEKDQQISAVSLLVTEKVAVALPCIQCIDWQCDGI